VINAKLQNLRHCAIKLKRLTTIEMELKLQGDYKLNRIEGFANHRRRWSTVPNSVVLTSKIRTINATLLKKKKKNSKIGSLE
jgi:hypothetical protein